LVLSAAEREYSQQGDEDLDRSAGLLLDIVRHEYLENDGSLAHLQSDLPLKLEGMIAQIFDSQGRLLMRSEDAPIPRLVDTSAGYFDVDLSSGHWRGVALRDADSDLQVLLAESGQHRHHSSDRLAIALWAPVLIGLPVLALVAQLFSRRALLPLAYAADDLAQRSATDLDPISFSGLPSEAQPLVNSFNGLLQRLAQVVDDQRHFASTVAHELRTPLASLKLDLQMLNNDVNQGAGASTHDAGELSEKARELLPRSLQTLDRTTQVIEQLLVLARLETTKAAPAQSPFDLSRLVEEILRQFSLRIEKRQINVGVEVERIELKGFEHPVYIALRNIIENAMRHAQSGGGVRISAAQTAEHWHIAVEDDGPGFGSPEAQKGALQLGMNIVERIVAAMGGRIAKDRSELLGGARVVLEFPRQA